MKKVFLLMLALVMSLTSTTTFAQNGVVPNAGFEDWSSVDPSVEFEMPNNWLTSDLFYAFLLEAETNMVKKTTDKKSGTAAILLKKDTVTVDLGGGFVIKDVFGSFALMLDFDTEAHGMPVTVRPAALKGFYKMVNPDKDSAYISAIAGKYDTTGDSLVDVGEGILYFTKATATYQPFTVPIIYTPGSKGIDTLDLEINCGGEVNTSNKTELYLDDLALQWAVSADEYDAVPISIYPNPTIEFANFDFTAVKEAAAIELFDISGKVVKRERINASIFQVNLAELSKGMYIYKVYDNSNKTLKTGKIEVLK
jgi:Secretion system C-terminal sorting domain